MPTISPGDIQKEYPNIHPNYNLERWCKIINSRPEPFVGLRFWFSNDQCWYTVTSIEPANLQFTAQQDNSSIVYSFYTYKSDIGLEFRLPFEPNCPEHPKQPRFNQLLADPKASKTCFYWMFDAVSMKWRKLIHVERPDAGLHAWFQDVEEPVIHFGFLRNEIACLIRGRQWTVESDIPLVKTPNEPVDWLKLRFDTIEL